MRIRSSTYSLYGTTLSDFLINGIDYVSRSICLLRSNVQTLFSLPVTFVRRVKSEPADLKYSTRFRIAKLKESGQKRREERVEVINLTLGSDVPSMRESFTENKVDDLSTEHFLVIRFFLPSQ